MRLIFLSERFYHKHRDHHEIMKKQDRPYACLAVEIDSCTFAIPFRHHIGHKYGFRTVGVCGLDYSKAVVITEEDVGEGTPQIDQEEFDAIRGKDRMIENGMRKYVRLYKKAVQQKDNPSYENIRIYSTLKYFEEQLHI